MMKEIIPYLSFIVAIVVVLLSYWKEITVKRESELFIKKQFFYERIINYFNAALSQRDPTHRKELSGIYNLSYIYCSDEVIIILNRFFDMMSKKDLFHVSEVRNILVDLLTALRKDLKINTSLTKKDYKALFEKKP